MTSRDFCYWLQGFFEIGRAGLGEDPLEMDAEQILMIERHLAMVFKHEIDPGLGTPEHQAELQKIHDRLEMIEQAPVRVIDPNARYTC